jgi:hypothetical protein
MKKLHYSFGYYLREVTRHPVCTWHWRMSASGSLTGESEIAAILRDACALRTHAPQEEGSGWLRRFNNFSPHPEEHAGSARVRLEGWPRRFSLRPSFETHVRLSAHAPQDEGRKEPHP